MNPDLLGAQKLAYEPCGWVCENLIQNPESTEYGACSFSLNHRRIQFRTGKITPTKNGQFVTLWKRTPSGVIAPYDSSDPIDLVVISVRSGERWGQFIFPKELLLKKNILSTEGKGGKRALRVYPPWDSAESSQAKQTQAWQQKYFLGLPCATHCVLTLFS